ncbi:unnamed protein product [Notodromas monacha]|uniref:Transcription initiation factor TFIID subunit 12 n=1 Tax=Notodromas monacha TaxID=399045 RepID=A0A7R9GIS4_9CRUS|nr:unnamed protein product [Notodromas monacha]CAG0924237.1 unnamed protein product [Notodromas monacha]
MGLCFEKVLTRTRLQDLLREIDPNEHLDDDVEEVLLQAADNFVDDVISRACDLAKHRKGTTLEAQDVLLVLQGQLNMWIPGYGSAEEHQVPKMPSQSTSEAHRQRMALIRKFSKK